MTLSTIISASTSKSSGYAPSDERYWIDLFRQRPEVLHDFLVDMYSLASAKKSTGRLGRLPRIAPSSLDELASLVVPHYSNKPFMDAFEDLRSDHGSKVSDLVRAGFPVSKTTLYALVAGTKPVINMADITGSMRLLRDIAVFFAVSPMYFREFRELYVITVTLQLMEENPSMSHHMVVTLERARDDRDTGTD